MSCFSTSTLSFGFLIVEIAADDVLAGKMVVRLPRFSLLSTASKLTVLILVEGSNPEWWNDDWWVDELISWGVVLVNGSVYGKRLFVCCIVLELGIFAPNLVALSEMRVACWLTYVLVILSLWIRVDAWNSKLDIFRERDVVTLAKRLRGRTVLLLDSENCLRLAWDDAMDGSKIVLDS